MLSPWQLHLLDKPNQSLRMREGWGINPIINTSTTPPPPPPPPKFYREWSIYFTSFISKGREGYMHMHLLTKYWFIRTRLNILKIILYKVLVLYYCQACYLHATRSSSYELVFTVIKHHTQHWMHFSWHWKYLMKVQIENLQGTKYKKDRYAQGAKLYKPVNVQLLLP